MLPQTLNMHILEVEVQLGQCSPSSLTCKYLQACGAHLSVSALLNRQSQCCLGSYVQGGRGWSFLPALSGGGIMAELVAASLPLGTKKCKGRQSQKVLK